MSAIDKEPFPRIALIGMGSLLAISVVAAAAGRVQHLTAPPQAAPAAVRAVDLRFHDEADGSVSVRAVADNRLVASVAPGTGGFVRGVMRGLARDRIRRHIGQQAPFRLTEAAAGRLWLQDTATGRRIDLQAFGATNRSAFAQMMPAPGTRS